MDWKDKSETKLAKSDWLQHSQTFFDQLEFFLIL